MDQRTMSTQHALFAAATGITGTLLWRALRPPRPIRLEQSKDSQYGIKQMKSAFFLLKIFRICILGLTAMNAVASVAGPPLAHAFGHRAPYSTQVDPMFLTWNPVSASVLALIASGAAARLYAMKELGINFTFDLHDPNQLTTNGMYRYMQHPSYTTAIASCLTGTVWFLRCNGAVGVFLPPGLFDVLLKIQAPLHVLIGTACMAGLARRVRDEEEMLRSKFGKQWEDWHNKTPRFIPFLF